jgi:hypothetical protein
MLNHIPDNVNRHREICSGGFRFRRPVQASAEDFRSVGASHRASPQQLSVAVRISHERGDFCSCLAVDFVRKTVYLRQASLCTVTEESQNHPSGKRRWPFLRDLNLSALTQAFDCSSQSFYRSIPIRRPPLQSASP